MVNGRVAYQIMENSWPRFAQDESMPDYMQDYGQIWINARKILVSNSRSEAAFNTEVINGPDVIPQLAELRGTTDGDIGIGGANLATQILEAGLLDELLLFIHPVILGSGRPLFDRVDQSVDFDLLESADFEGGVSMRRYALVKS